MTRPALRMEEARFLRTDGRPARLKTSTGLTPYRAAEEAMIARARAVREAGAEELVWFLEHPPLYTAGTTARLEDLRQPDRFPVFETGRGGQYTYHGPGQRVVYLMLDLAARRRDVRAFVAAIEAWIIAALARVDVDAFTTPDRVGVWVRDSRDPRREEKIAAIGVRLKRWVSFHGVAVNIAPDLDHFNGVTPCGIDDARYGVTSLEALGVANGADGLAAFDRVLIETYANVFGPILPENDGIRD